MRSIVATVIAFSGVVAAGAGIAHATGGGGSIASAPVVSSGVQQAGSTASFTDTCQNGYEFWTLQLKQGDLVKITWGTPTAVDKLALFAPGTADSDDSGGCIYASGWANWATAPVFSDINAVASSTRLSQTTVTASGSYPLVFVDTTGAAHAGAYSFTAVVLHGASVSLPQVASIPGEGKLTAAVLAPDSSPITDSALKLTLNGYWSIVPGAPPSAHKLATAKPVDGSATFKYSLPPGVWRKKIQLEIFGGGTSYQAVKTAKKHVQVRPEMQPILLSPAQLKAESKILGQQIYWAGPEKGHHYEFTRTTDGYAYVRYLPAGVKAGDPRSKFLVVATYPFVGAYGSLKKFAKGKAIAGPHGSIYFVKPASPTNVVVAFPRIDYQMEVYDPSPAVARRVVTQGLLVPVR